MRNKILTLTGPSGSGKSTLANLLIDKHGFKNIISHTTRASRPGEVSGKDYHFVSDEEFLKLDKEGKLVEKVQFNGKYYGLTSDEVNRVHSEGGIPVLVVEPNGLKQVSRYCRDNDLELISVYISGELEILINRILSRELLGKMYDPNSVKYLSKRIFSLVDEINNWGVEFPYSRTFMKYDNETEGMILDTILEITSG